ncbi:MAG: hypothetical protein WA510_27770 [Acidobacteriaceae bacterium]
MSSTGQKLFDLLPSVYRLRDAALAQTLNGFTPADNAQLQALQATPPPLTTAQQQQLAQLTARSYGPLQALLTLVDEQLAIVGEDLSQLYDNQFIETCAPWVIPYIGDLIGYKLVNGVASAVASPRAEVANTISLRRRKGTVLVLEQLARDVTGWGAHAVEFFEVLADTQYMNHLRPWNHYCPDLRRWQPRAYMNTGFDRTAHTIDVRLISNESGRYNIQNIGIFLWSLNAYEVTLSPCSTVAASADCFRFSALGRDTVLFNNPISQGADITALAQPENVPARLLRHVLSHDIRQAALPTPGSVYYGAQASLGIYLTEGSPPTPALQPADKIRVCNLSGSDGSWNNMPAMGGLITVDPELGRIAVPPGTTGTPPVVSWYYGFNAELGGGEYAREATFTASPQQVIVRVPGDWPTISAALATLPGDGVVEVSDSGTYSEAGGLNISVAAHGHIELRAADGVRPTLFLGGEIAVTGGVDAIFDINGFVIAYEPPVGGTNPAALLSSLASSSNQLGTLNVVHCTFVPGWALQSSGEPQAAYQGLPSVLIQTPGVAFVAQNSILGGLWVIAEASASLTNCIIDATDPALVAYVESVDSSNQQPSPGGALTLVGCTVIGLMYASVFTLVSDCIFWSELPQPPCLALPLNPPPFESVYYTTPPDSAGDQLVVGKPQTTVEPLPQLLNSIPLPDEQNQQICGPVQLAPGLSFNAYVPTAAERTGNFSAFAASLTDPSPGTNPPITGGEIPPARWTDVFAWRVAPRLSERWMASLWSARKQQGCIRFSFVPIGAILPRNFACVQQAPCEPQPLFYSLRYGDPGYCKLLPSTDSSIREGADDGGEMGAFHLVLAPQRETDLRTRLQEYMPVNLQYGIFYEN